MKLGLIGSRGHMHYVLEGLEALPHVRVVGLSSGTPEDDVEGLRALRTQFAANCDHGHIPEYYPHYQDMLDRCRPDVVSVCGPFELHTAMCLEAFQRGVHVFCEKPVALTLEELSRLKAAWFAANQRFATNRPAQPVVHFSAMMGLRYDPAFYTAWKAVKAGAVGEVRLIQTQKSYKLGERPVYYRRRATYGGTIPWVGSHAIDWIYWFSGQDFLSVYAQHSTQGNRGNDELEVSALCQFTLTNQVIASVSLDYFRPPSASTHGDDRIRVVGDQGVIEVRQSEQFAANRVYLIPADGEGQQLEVGCDRQIFRDFIAQVERRAASLLPAEDIFVVTEACLRARQSADEGRVVYFGDSSQRTEG